ncbi:hypothetical protein [Flavobacterium psychrotolerans]|uniref:Membrane or secreted protein n=1 Tax=Flavobacterium psychrotolerans TaxID=2169410 RepID=A0A2U1JNQ5_9FLAO|nr:hypothetical protein [Flavobacterium psychrotolerans]PWA06801.1 hypothetical protein DB895_02105 [Flavobacterium psychrotolerans]
MKKNIVLFILFIFPIVAYLFFATGVNSFMFLPTVTPNIPDLGHWHSLNGEPVTLNKKITILGFTGNNIVYNKGNYFNLNQKIYNKNREFKDFQFVMVAPEGTQEQVKEILKGLSGLTDVSKWLFVFAPTNEIQAYYNTLKLKGKLDTHSGTSNVFIIDKKRNLRGRKDKDEYKEGYDTASPSDLYNQMTDDVKVILAEYRLALKRNNADRQI